MRVERHRPWARAIALLAGLVLMTGCGVIAAQCQPPRPDPPPGDDPPPCGSVNVFADDFEDDALARGWIRHGELRVTEQEGRLEIIPLDEAVGLSRGGIFSKASMSLRDTSLRVELLWPAVEHDAAFACLQFGPEGEDQVSICQVGARLVASNTTDPVPPPSEITFAADDHRFLQLREADGQLFFEASYDTLTWQLVGQCPTPRFVDYGQIVLTAGTSDSVASTETVAFDNLNQGLPPAVWCPSSQLRDAFDGPALSPAWKVQIDGYNDCDVQLVQSHDEGGQLELSLSVSTDQPYSCAVASTARYAMDDDAISVCILDAPNVDQDTFTGLTLWLPGDLTALIGLLPTDVWAEVQRAGVWQASERAFADGPVCVRVSGADGMIDLGWRSLGESTWRSMLTFETEQTLDEVRVGLTVKHKGASCCENPLSLTARFDNYNQE